MSAELFSSKPYEDFELVAPIVETVAPTEAEPHPQLSINQWLGPVALFGAHHTGELYFYDQEAA